jgi:hypothetical protein
MPLYRTFLLSPASCRGERARLLFSEDATCLQAKRVRSTQGLPVGELFSFLRGLYFRGKLAYAQAFANPAPKAPGVLVITPTQGLLLPDQPVTLELVREFSSVDIKEDNIRYRSPFEKDAKILDALIGSNSRKKMKILQPGTEALFFLTRPVIVVIKSAGSIGLVICS